MSSTINENANALARELIRLLVLQKEYTQTRLGEMLGIDQSQIARLSAANSRAGTSADVLVAAARLLDREDEAIEALFPRNLSSDVRLVDPYPNRAIAVRAARRLGYGASAIEFVESAGLDSSEDRPARWWFERIQDRERIYEDPLKPAERKSQPFRPKASP